MKVHGKGATEASRLGEGGSGSSAASHERLEGYGESARKESMTEDE